MLTSFVRVIKFAFQGFWRNIWLSIINITILVLTLFIINFLIGFNLLADNAIQVVNEKVDVGLYFQQNVSSEKITEIKNKIAESYYIKDVIYVSSEDALSDFEERHASDEDIISALNELKNDDGQIFSASLKIKAKDMAMYDDILDELKNSQYRDLFEIDEMEFQDYSRMTNRLYDISNRVKLIGYVISLIFIMIALMMVYNTIKIATYTHREEIGIMKLVGATDNFIKIPFLVEILMYNLIALIVVVILFYTFLSIVSPFINKLFTDYPFDIIAYFNHNFILIFLGQFIIMALFSVISSSIAIKKFIKV